MAASSPRPEDKHHHHHSPAALQRSLALIYLVIVLYAVAFMSQQPVQQFHVVNLGGESNSSFLYLRSFFACAQFAGSLISGALVDRFGAKNALLLSFASGAASYALTAAASSLTMLFVAQVPTIFLHAMLAARAFITAYVPEEERAVALGRLIVAYGIGMVVGPALGGYLASVSLTLAALGAAALSVCSAACVATLPRRWPKLPPMSQTPCWPRPGSGGGYEREQGPKNPRDARRDRAPDRRA